MLFRCISDEQPTLLIDNGKLTEYKMLSNGIYYYLSLDIEFKRYKYKTSKEDLFRYYQHPYIETVGDIQTYYNILKFEGPSNFIISNVTGWNQINISNGLLIPVLWKHVEYKYVINGKIEDGQNKIYFHGAKDNTVFDSHNDDYKKNDTSLIKENKKFKNQEPIDPYTTTLLSIYLFNPETKEFSDAETDKYNIIASFFELNYTHIFNLCYRFKENIVIELRTKDKFIDTNMKYEFESIADEYKVRCYCENIYNKENHIYVHQAPYIEKPIESEKELTSAINIYNYFCKQPVDKIMNLMTELEDSYSLVSAIFAMTKRRPIDLLSLLNTNILDYRHKLSTNANITDYAEKNNIKIKLTLDKRFILDIPVHKNNIISVNLFDNVVNKFLDPKTVLDDML